MLMLILIRILLLSLLSLYNNAIMAAAIYNQLLNTLNASIASLSMSLDPAVAFFQQFAVLGMSCYLKYHLLCI